MIRVTRAMLRRYPSSVKSTFKKIHQENQELKSTLQAIQSLIEKGSGTAQLHQIIEDKLLHMSEISIEENAFDHT